MSRRRGGGRGLHPPAPPARALAWLRPQPRAVLRGSRPIPQHWPREAHVEADIRLEHLFRVVDADGQLERQAARRRNGGFAGSIRLRDMQSPCVSGTRRPPPTPATTSTTARTACSRSVIGKDRRLSLSRAARHDGREQAADQDDVQPRRAVVYYKGCSTGGSMGIHAATRFPTIRRHHRRRAGDRHIHIIRRGLPAGLLARNPDMAISPERRNWSAKR